MKIIKATIEDVPSIYKLIKVYSEKQILLPRSETTITEELPLTWVVKDNDNVVGVGNLISFDEHLFEVRGLVIDAQFRSQHLGQKIISQMVKHLKNQQDYKKISLFALTYEPKFFEACNFQEVKKEKFPAKIYEVCQFCSKQDDCKEIAVELNWDKYNKQEHLKLEEGKKLNLDFNKLKNINTMVIPAVVQDYKSKEVLIVGYVNKEALSYAIENKVATFFSTSRNELWVKGATSGNTLKLHELKVNCEQNSILYLVEILGTGSCHTKNKKGIYRRSCYYRQVDLNDINQDLKFTE